MLMGNMLPNNFSQIWGQPATTDLIGPEFVWSATELSHKVGVGSITVLQVYPGAGTPVLQNLVPALSLLRNYFAKSGLVVLYLDPNQLPAALLEQLRKAAGVPVEVGSNAQNIASQMMAEEQKQKMERWRVQQETQTKIFQIQQDITVNKARTQDKAYNAWDAYIRN